MFKTTNIGPDKLQDHTHFVDDLQLDSLTLMEIAVNVDQAFQVDLPEDEMQHITSVQSAAELVASILVKKATV